MLALRASGQVFIRSDSIDILTILTSMIMMRCDLGRADVGIPGALPYFLLDRESC